MTAFKRISVALALMVMAGAVQAQDYQQIDDTPSGGAMAFDLMLVRPISLVGTVLGSGLWLVQLPFNGIAAAASGSWSNAPAEKLVVEPFNYTFTRPLGRLE